MNLILIKIEIYNIKVMCQKYIAGFVFAFSNFFKIIFAIFYFRTAKIPFGFSISDSKYLY